MSDHDGKVVQLKPEKQDETDPPFRLIGMKIGKAQADGTNGKGQPVKVDTGYKMRCEFLDREPSPLIVQTNPDQKGQHNVQFEIPLNITAGDFVQLLRAVADQTAEYLQIEDREYGKPEAQDSEQDQEEGESGEEEAVPEDPEQHPTPEKGA